MEQVKLGDILRLMTLFCLCFSLCFPYFIFSTVQMGYLLLTLFSQGRDVPHRKAQVAFSLAFVFQNAKCLGELKVLANRKGRRVSTKEEWKKTLKKTKLASG